MAHNPEDNWRNDPGLSSIVRYKKKFALFPKKCDDGTHVWFENYYTKYQYWGYSRGVNIDSYINDSMHEDKLESITESEYIVRKLTEGL